MRRLILPLTALFLLGDQRLAAKESVISVDLYMGVARPEDARYIEDIVGPSRTVSIVIHGIDIHQKKTQRVEMKGPLNTERVSSLLQAVFGSDTSYWMLKHDLRMSVVGDEYRAKVSTSYVCGHLCGGGVSYFYTFDSAHWRYLYSCDRWIS